MARSFAIGDIHGCSKTFQHLVLEGIQLRKSDQIICVGDYIDRGPDSKGVVDFILELREKGYQIQTLRGNHEQMLLDALEDEENFQHWLANGGKTALESFGVRHVSDIPGAYIDFFKDTRFWYETGTHIFVHAGLNCSIEDPFSDKMAMLWLRDSDIDPKKTNGRKVVHGHTPQPIHVITAPTRGYAINLDAGCVLKDTASMGYLVALDLSTEEFLVVKNCEV